MKTEKYYNRAIQANYNRATFWFRAMSLADPYHAEWGKYADAMDAVISEMVPVVRCKDCKFHGTEIQQRNGTKRVRCTLIDEYKSENWYCADGEKRDG